VETAPRQAGLTKDGRSREVLTYRYGIDEIGLDSYPRDLTKSTRLSVLECQGQRPRRADDQSEHLEWKRFFDLCLIVR
jgi:hypothetical protein